MDVAALIGWSCFIALLIALSKWLLRYYRSWKMISTIPGPKQYPFIGRVLDFQGNDFLDVLGKWWNEFYMNPTGLFAFTLFNEHLVFPCNPETLEKVINVSLHKDFSYSFLKPWLGEGLLTSDGERWRRKRKILTPAFHFRILEEFIDVFNEHGKIMVNKLKEEKRETFDVFPFVTLCTLDAICETAMGQCVHAQHEGDSEYVRALYGIAEIIHQRTLRPLWWSDFIFSFLSEGKLHAKYLKTLHDFTDKVIQERKAARKSEKSKPKVEEVKDDVFGKKKRLAFLDLILDASETGNFLTDREIREEVDTFMFEGHDTTAAAISWAIFLLGHYPEMQKRVQDEIDSVMGLEDRDITSEDIKQFKFMDCVIKESLRIYPSVPVVSRLVTKDTVIGDCKIPENTSVSFFIYYLHKDPRIFPDPDKFDPDRFASSDSPDRHPYSFVPFSAGSRNCIGQKFAMMEVKVILAHFLRSFNVESMEQREDLKLVMHLILRPKNGVVIKITPREPLLKL